MYLKTLGNNYYKILELGFNFLAISYFLLAAFYFLQMGGGGGDEILFINDLEVINDLGWINAIEKNISIPYMVLAYPISKIVTPYIALRLTNLLVILLLFYYFITKTIINRILYFLLFYISTAGFFFFGTNDTLFTVSLAIFLCEIYFIANKKSHNLNIALIAISVAIFTRELYIIYLPVILIAFYIVSLKPVRVNKKNWISLLMFIILLSFNLPSIIENKTLSYDKKSPPESFNVTWTQRQYLAQLMVNDGELLDFQHPSWEMTQDYVNKNGDDSLPDNVLKGIYQDPVLTVKELFKDSKWTLFYSSRGLGLILFITLGYLFVNIYKNKKICIQDFLPISLLIMIFTFSLIIISYIELRWLSPIFLAIIIYYGELMKENKIGTKLKVLNLLYFISISIYGLIRLIDKIY